MSSSDDGGPGRREVAWRVFAAEFDDATLEHSQSDEERAPNYVVTPTGARVNRLFVVGVLTEVEDVTDEVLRARIVDPTGAFVVYAGQYQPEAMAYLDGATPPAFVSVTGKARTFQPEDSDLIYTSIRPESINAVDSETRDRWTIGAAKQTIDRVDAFEKALDSGRRGAELEGYLKEEGVRDDLAAGIALALDHYGTTYDYLAAVRSLAEDALRVVAGDLEAGDIEPLAVEPDEGEGAGVAPTPGAGAGAETPTTEASAEVSHEREGGEPEIETTAARASGDAGAVEPEGGSDEPEVEDAEDSAEVGAPTDSAPEVEPEEPAAEAEPEPAEEDVDVSDLGTGGVGDEMYEMDEEERREVEEEYGVEFSSGAEIGEPGQADIEAPGPGTEASEEDEVVEEVDTEPGEPAPGPVSDEEAVGESAEQAAAEPESESEPEPAVEEPEPEGETVEEPEPDEAEETGGKPEPGDLEAVVMEYMRDLDEGDGADHDALVTAVTGDYDVTAENVEDAIQDALMGGQCYEAGDDALKPI